MTGGVGSSVTAVTLGVWRSTVVLGITMFVCSRTRSDVMVGKRRDEPGKDTTVVGAPGSVLVNSCSSTGMLVGSVPVSRLDVDACGIDCVIDGRAPTSRVLVGSSGTKTWLVETWLVERTPPTELIAEPSGTAADSVKASLTKLERIGCAVPV